MLPRPRESVFASGIDSYRGDINAVCPPNLRECVLAMEDCCEEVGDLMSITTATSSKHYTRRMKPNSFSEMAHSICPA